MASILPLVQSQPSRTLRTGERLISEGDFSGEIYVLEHGRLLVERNGITIAGIAEPGALIGEMSVLLGTDHTADVTAEAETTVRVIEDAIGFLERTPLVALHVATLACARLDATSALLVELRKQAAGRHEEQGVFGRLLQALTNPPPPPPPRRGPRVTRLLHE
ncbi:MAG: cyclic nucleotide-binding domain-containing protein [Devosia sp.]|nr:cyclic nucleotide-binding domain-containing protein [Devosia sp.]